MNNKQFVVNLAKLGETSKRFAPRRESTVCCKTKVFQYQNDNFQKAFS